MTAQEMPHRGSVTLPILFLLVFMATAGAVAQVTTNLLNINFGGGSKVGLSGTGLTTNDTWNAISGSANFTTNNLLWANATTSSVSLTFTNLPWNGSIDGLDDGMLRTYVSGTAFDFGESVVVPAIITISNLPPSTYKVYAYGSGQYPETDHESFTLTVGTNSYGTKTTSASWFDPATEPLAEDIQYVVFTNVVVTNGQVLTLDLAGYYNHTVNGLQIIDVTPTPTLPSVTFSPGAGATVPVSVSLSVTNHTDATIYYTLDGSTPTTSSSVYSTSLSLSNATTVKAFATKTNYLNSAVTSAFYPLPQLPNVEFTPEDNALLPVNLALSVPGHTNATIYYTLNGSTPTTNSSIYSGLISLASSNWIYSSNVAPTMTSYTAPSGNTVTYSSEKSGDSGKAWKVFDKGLTSTSYWLASGTTNEWVAIEMSGPKVIGRYSISTRTNATDGPMAWRLEGWNGSQYVALDTRESEPAWFSNERRDYICQTNGLYSKYRLYVKNGYAASDNTTGRISIGEVGLMKASATVVAFATKALHYNSGVALAEYNAPASTLPPIAPVPVPSIYPGSFSDPVSVSFSSTLSGAGYEYSVDGFNWLAYTNSVLVQSNMSLLGRTVKAGYEPSSAIGGSYFVQIPQVLIYPTTRVFTNPVTVSLSNTVSGASINYRRGTNSWLTYTNSFVISNTTLLSVSASHASYLSRTNTTTFDIVSTNLPSLGTLLNINFGTGSKTGFAAVGFATNDVWNLVTNSVLSTNTALRWSSGTTSAVSVVISNLPSTYGNSYSDAMLGTYLTGPTYYFDEEYNPVPIPAGVEVRNLPMGRYDLFLYAVNASPDYEAGGFELTVGSVTNGTKYTSTFDIYSGWPALEEGKQYVVFTNVSVGEGETVGIKLTGGEGYILNGLQLMVQSGGPAPVPRPSVSPANGTFTEPTTVTITNYWVGGLIRYSFDGTNWITNTSVTLLESATLYIQALKDGYLASGISTNTFTINLPTASAPVIIPAPGEFAMTQLVTFTNSLSGSSYRYSFDGSIWVTNNTAVISSNSSLLVQGIKYGYLHSQSVTGSYTINTNLILTNGGLININFGSGSKTGYAATGISTNDAWNLIAGSALRRTNSLIWANGSTAQVWLTITNLAYSNTTYGVDDAMLGSFIYGPYYEYETDIVRPALIMIGNLRPGAYSIYCYGVSGSSDPYYNESFTLKVGTNSHGTKSTVTYSFDPTTEPLTEGGQFVVFTNVVIEAGQPLILELAGYSDRHTVNGLQLLSEEAVLQVPAPVVSPAGGTFTEPTTVILSNLWAGGLTRYSFDGTNWFTNSSVTLLESTVLYVQAIKGNYLGSTIVTNTFTINLPTAPVPVLLPGDGEYPLQQLISFGNGLAGSGYRYSFNGTAWVTNSTAVITTNSTLLVQSIKYGYLPSQSVTGNYTINTNLVLTNSGLLNINFGSGSKTGFAAIGITTNDVWNVLTTNNTLASVTNPISGFVWADGSNAFVSVVITNLSYSGTNANTDAMLKSFLYHPAYSGGDPLNSDVYVRNLPPGQYNVLVYSMGTQPASDDRTGFYLSVNGSLEQGKWVNPEAAEFDVVTNALTENLQYVVFTNILVEAAQSMRIRPVSGGYNKVVNGLQISRTGEPKVPVPAVSPGAGTFTNAISITISNSLAGVSNFYSTNGTDWSSVSGTVSLDGGATLYAKSTKSGLLGSDVVTNEYLFVAQPPTVSPGSGTYTNALSVTFSTALSGGSFQVSTNGGTNWASASSPYTVDGQVVLLTRVVKSGYQASTAVTNSYVFQAPIPTVDPEGGEFTGPVTVTLSSYLSGAVYRYTTNGTDWYSYSGSLVLDGTALLQAKTTKTGYTDSAVVTNQFTFALPDTTITPNGGIFTNALPLGLTNAVSGAVLSYSVDGGSNWLAYLDNLVMDGIPTGDGTILVRATKGGYATNIVESDLFYFVLNSPLVTPASGTFTNATTVSMGGSGTNVIYLIRTNYSDWLTYTNSWSADGELMLISKATKTNYHDSAMVTNEYVFVLTPSVFSPAQGTFTNATTITVTNVQTGVAMEYSADDGGTWQLFTNTFSLDGIGNGTGIVYVRSSRPGYVTRVDESGVYRFTLPGPTFSYDSGTYTNVIYVALTNSVAGVTNEFSRDGIQWEPYVEAVSISHTTTLHARSTKAGYLYGGDANYPASDGFSLIQGLNNWSYLYSATNQGLPSSFLPFIDEVLGEWFGPVETGAYIGVNYQHPSLTNDSIRTFTAPVTGLVQITGSVQLVEDPGTNGVLCRVLLNGSVLMDWASITNTTTNIVISILTNVAAGDLLHFQVAAGSTNTQSLVTFIPTVRYDCSKTYTYADSDGDGLSDVEEALFGTNSGLTDTLGDGMSDFWKMLLGRNPAVGAVEDTGDLIRLRRYTPLK